MDGADLEAGLGEGPFDRLVVTAGLFDGDDEVVEPMVVEGVMELRDGALEPIAVVGNLDGCDQTLCPTCDARRVGSATP
jgi:hypothetical protein